MPFEQLPPEAQQQVLARFPHAGPGDGFQYYLFTDGTLMGRQVPGSRFMELWPDPEEDAA